MIDIKLRNVTIEDANKALECIEHFMEYYSDKRGVRDGIGYPYPYPGYYVYRTEKTVVCVGQYEDR